MCNITGVNLTSIDLNLLLVLHTVLEERSATLAARRLHVTQSAVSNSLARLRALLDDPLVVRTGNGLTPTPRARELAPFLHTAMIQLRAAIERTEPTDPAQIARQFTFACADSQLVDDVPRVVAALARKMPRARLNVVSIDYMLANAGLETGLVDVATGPRVSQPGLFCTELYHDDGVVVLRRDHPRVGRKLTRELFNQLEHVDVFVALGQAGHGHRMAERFFARNGLRRIIAVTVPTFAAAAMVAARTDLLACLPRRVADSLAQHFPVRTLDLPVRGLTIPLNLIWHARTHGDTSAKHFRDVLLATLRDRTNFRPR